MLVWLGLPFLTTKPCIKHILRAVYVTVVGVVPCDSGILSRILSKGAPPTAQTVPFRGEREIFTCRISTSP